MININHYIKHYYPIMRARTHTNASMLSKFITNVFINKTNTC